MNIWSVICEFNPFHNGHKYMLSEMRRNGAEYIVACMSGNFTQRGDFAVYDKYTRAKSALLNGADLVIELPVTYACSGAERFAFGGITLLNALGCVDAVCFGSESGNINLLEKACNAVTGEQTADKIKHYLSLGQTFALARENAVNDIYGDEISAVLREPNNTLAVEYLKALKRLNSTITPLTVKRTGTGHNSMQAYGNIASATMIRELINTQNKDYFQYIPENTRSVIGNVQNIPPKYSRTNKLESAFLYRLRMMSKSEFSNLPDISEGLENRLYSAVHQANSLNEVLALTKCKRYTLARIRRIIMYAFLQFTKDDFNIQPDYIKVLGFSQNGRTILKTLRTTAKLPVIMRYSDVSKLSSEVQYLYSLETRCDDIFSLSGETVLQCGQNLTSQLVISG